jgi:hypothetical protein
MGSLAGVVGYLVGIGCLSPQERTSSREVFPVGDRIVIWFDQTGAQPPVSLITGRDYDSTVDEEFSCGGEAP